MYALSVGFSALRVGESVKRGVLDVAISAALLANKWVHLGFDFQVWLSGGNVSVRCVLIMHEA